MPGETISALAEAYTQGRLSRRRFIQRMIGAGLGAPVIASVLAACGSSTKKPSGATQQTGASAPASAIAAGSATAAPAANADTFQPTKRGGGGQLKLLWWQAPTLLNIHLSTGTTNNDASTVFTEPLAYFDSQANLFPVLAAEIPSLENGAVAKDGTSVTWKLKQGVTWHDGQPFTADDVVFTWQYITDPGTGATSIGNYKTVASVDKIDDHTAKVTFTQPTPYWQTAFVGGAGHIFPKHLIEPFKGANSRNSPYNLKPVGTGAYKFDSFVPGDNLQASLYPNYHVPNRPFFDTIYLKGGGDAVSAARAVLQTGDYDYGWNMQVEYDQLVNLQKGGPGAILIWPGSSCEQLFINLTDPNTEVDGERSSVKSKHPFFSDPQVRKAFTLLIDRKTVTDQLYGKEGDIGLYIVFNPARYAPNPPSPWEFNTQKAAQMLDAAGWTKGSDGIRQKNGVRMHVVFSTSVNSLRQNEQAVIKQAMQSIGIQVDLKSVDSGVFFGDSTNPDSYPAFFTDVEMFTTGPSIDPQSFMQRWVSTEIAQKANSWSKPNINRYQNPAFDALWNQAAAELDPVKRAGYFQKMNQIIIDDAIDIPITARNAVAVAKSNLKGTDLSTWSSDLYKLAYWRH
jgi:peptide/nickel transport system substrate-binding protein